MGLHWGHSPPVHEGQHDCGDYCNRSKWLHALPAPGFDVVDLGHSEASALYIARFFSPECAVPVSVICCHGSSCSECRSHGRICTAYKPGSGLRLSQSATPAPALTLGVRHLSCGAVHPCSGRLTCPAGPHSRPRGAAFGLASGLRFACIPAAIPRGRTVGLGVQHLYCGVSHCAWGARHLSGGADQSLCAVPVMPARLNAFALSILFAGRCPRPDGLPQYRQRGAGVLIMGNGLSCGLTWEVCTPIPPAPTLRHKGFGRRCEGRIDSSTRTPF